MNADEEERISNLRSSAFICGSILFVRLMRFGFICFSFFCRTASSSRLRRLLLLLLTVFLLAELDAQPHALLDGQAWVIEVHVRRQ